MSSKIEVQFSIQNFDEQYLAHLSNEFQKYDKDGSGRLDKEEFVKWLVDGGTKKTQAKRIFYVADTDHDGSLTLEEFKKYAKLQQDLVIKGETKEYARMVFNAVDSDKNGYLDKKEFKKFMKLMNTPVNFFNSNKKFNKFDADDSGTIEFDEICAVIDFQSKALLT